MELKTKCSKMAGKDRPLRCITEIRPHAAQKVPVRGHSSSSFFLISFPDLWLTPPLHVMTWHMNDDVAVVWTSTALRANRYSCIYFSMGRMGTLCTRARGMAKGRLRTGVGPSKLHHWKVHRNSCPSAGSQSLRAIFHNCALTFI